MIELLLHQWKEKIRSPFWQKSIFLNILMGLLGVYLLLNFLAIGYFADVILKKAFPDNDVVESFSRILFYYFTFDLIFRFFAQKLPTLSIQPYLILPIRKSKLLHYPLIKSVPDFVNLVGFLLIIPFFVKIICHTYPPLFSIVWIVTLLSFIATNNFLNFSLKKYFAKQPLLIVLLLVIVGVIGYLDISKVISFSGIFSSNLLRIANTPVLIIIPLLIAAISYYIGYMLLRKNAYIEDTVTNQHVNTSDLSFLTRYGAIGNLMQTEIKMILRNKRPKSLLMVSILFMAYGFIFYQDKNINNYFTLIFCGFFITSAFGITYGQYNFSWESTYFDGYMTNKISLFDYVKSKYLLFALTSIISFLVTLPYAIISYKIALINVAMVLYNIGISSIILLLFCTYNTARIDLGRSQFMNYQGTSVTQFISVLPVMGIPILICLLFKLFDAIPYGILALGLLGLTAIVFNKFLLQLVVKQLVRRKYKMALGFRQI